LPNFLAGDGERALAAQHLDAGGFEFLEIARGANPLERTGDQFPYGIFRHAC